MNTTASSDPVARARALLGANRCAEARNVLLARVQKRPGDHLAWTLLGETYCALGDGTAAAAALERALAIVPAHGPAWYLVGVVHYVASRLEAAEGALLRGAEDAESRERSLRLLAHVYFLLRRLDAAGETYRKLLADVPDSLPAWRDLIQVLHQADRLDEVEAEIARGRSLPLPQTVVELTDLVLLPKIYRNAEEVAHWRERVEQRLDTMEKTPLRLAAADLDSVPSHFSLAYQGINDRPLMERLGTLYRRICPELAYRAPHIDGWREPGERIHLGIYSAFLRSHTIGKLYYGLVKYLDRSRFRVTVFVPLNEQKDAFAEQFRAAADEYVSIPENFAVTCETIARYRLDALLYPDIGMHRLSYFLGHARLAPLQMTSWGHPVTTGIPAIDEFLSSELLEPEVAETHYSERLVRFSRLPACYQRYLLPPLKSRAALGLPGDRHLYFCPQSLFKILPDFDLALRAILERDPLADLYFVEGEDKSWRGALMQRLEQTLGREAGRVRFLPRMGLSDFLGVIQAADVVLDPFHFGGGNTHYETLMLGTPVVTLPGAFMRGRVGLGCYRQLGVTDLVASDIESYVGLALKTAADGDFRAALRERILARGDALYHDLSWLREFEAHVAASLQRRQV